MPEWETAIAAGKKNYEVGVRNREMAIVYNG